MGDRRYCVWACNPDGDSEDTSKCIVEVHNDKRWGQCPFRRGHGTDGLYCRKHGEIASRAVAQQPQE